MNTPACVARVVRGFRRSRPEGIVYQVTDSLHEGRSVRVPGKDIAPTVSRWLAELGIDSPLVADLARAVRTGDWPAAHEIGSHLSVHVNVAP